MRYCNKCKCHKDESEFAVCKRNKSGLQTMCKVCSNKSCSEYRAKNKALVKENLAKWRAENKDHIKEYNYKWRKNNPELVKQISKISREKNAQKVKIAVDRWRKANKDRCVSYVNERRLRMLRRIPSWADLSKIEVKYELARKITSVTGIKHHVDHVIPLKGELVSGLHVPENLMVVASDYNLSKHNRWIP